MKTKKELHEEIMKRYLWKKKRDTIVPIVLVLMLVMVGICKFDKLFVDWYAFTKIYLIAIGAGYSFGMTIAFILPVDLKKQKQVINKKIKYRLNRIENLAEIITNESKNLTPEEQKAVAKIWKLREKISKLEVEYRLLEHEYN